MNSGSRYRPPAVPEGCLPNNQNGHARGVHVPDLVDRTRRSFEAGSDIDAVMGDYGPDSVWDMSSLGLGVYEGQVAIRRFFEDWWGSYREYRNQVEEIVDFGNGVIFSVLRLEGRLAGSDR